MKTVTKIDGVENMVKNQQSKILMEKALIPKGIYDLRIVILVECPKVEIKNPYIVHENRSSFYEDAS